MLLGDNLLRELRMVEKQTFPLPGFLKAHIETVLNYVKMPCVPLLVNMELSILYQSLYCVYTSGSSATCLAHDRMIRMASILVSGKPALQAYSDRHFMAS